jgi:hypothetical protein
MTDTTTPPPAAPLPTALSEMDRLKLTLQKEKAARFQAEGMNLQLAMRQHQAQQGTLQKESMEFAKELQATYSLAPADEINEDGTIKRAPPAKKEG